MDMVVIFLELRAGIWMESKCASYVYHSAFILIGAHSFVEPNIFVKHLFLQII